MIYSRITVAPLRRSAEIDAFSYCIHSKPGHVLTALHIALQVVML
jgi:hypothetical protein